MKISAKFQHFVRKLKLSQKNDFFIKKKIYSLAIFLKILAYYPHKVRPLSLHFLAGSIVGICASYS